MPWRTLRETGPFWLSELLAQTSGQREPYRAQA